jgi:hypothetical protein
MEWKKKTSINHGKKVQSVSENVTYLPINLGKFASKAPMKLHIQMESQYGPLVFVICAKINLPTSCANCKPHAQRKGNNVSEYMIAE